MSDIHKSHVVEGTAVVYPKVSGSDEEIKVVLPEWVNEMLFDHFGAVNNPAGRQKSFDRNLDSSKSEVLVYLGTYFPRSLAESFLIFDCLLSERKLAESLGREKSICICSVGTGTGGDLLGLLLAIDKRAPEAARIEIVSIEGNKNAHEVMRDVLSEASSFLRPEIEVELVNHIFEPPDPFGCLDDFMPAYPSVFDFVISSKMLNELDGDRICERPYYDYCSVFTHLLKPAGVLLALDVTSRNGAGGSWTPKKLNGQINAFCIDQSQYKTLLPFLCNRFEGACGNDCYTKNAISVSYRNATNICSKICYRVIGPTELVEGLSSSTALWNCPITKANSRNCQLLNGNGEE